MARYKPLLPPFPTLPSREGETALHYCVAGAARAAGDAQQAQRALACARALVAAGASPYSPNTQRKSALDLATAAGLTQLQQVLAAVKRPAFVLPPEMGFLKKEEITTLGR